MVHPPTNTLCLPNEFTQPRTHFLLSLPTSPRIPTTIIMYHPQTDRDYPKSGAPPPQPYEDVTSSSAHHPKYAVAGAGGVITSATTRDVLNGRGQGVQRHPGNVKYRTLVFVNKVRAHCNNDDEISNSNSCDLVWGL